MSKNIDHSRILNVCILAQLAVSASSIYNTFETLNFIIFHKRKKVKFYSQKLPIIMLIHIPYYDLNKKSTEPFRDPKSPLKTVKHFCRKLT